MTSNGRGHLVQAPLQRNLKEAQGAKGGGGSKSWLGGGGGGGCLFPLRNEAAERSRRGKAGEWENGADGGAIAPEPGSQTSLSGTGLVPMS